MTIKAAIPVFENRVSSRLDCSESILLVSIEEGKIIQRQEIHLPHVKPLEKVQLLVHEGVRVLICGGLTEAHSNMLYGSGIKVIPWVRGEIEDVLTRFVRGTLSNTQEGESRMSS